MARVKLGSQPVGPSKQGVTAPDAPLVHGLETWPQALKGEPWQSGQVCVLEHASADPLANLAQSRFRRGNPDPS